MQRLCVKRASVLHLCRFSCKSLALFTQPFRIIYGAEVRQFSTDGEAHRAKHLCLHVCNSHRKLALWLLKRHDSTRHVDDVGVSPGVPLLIQTSGQFINEFFVLNYIIIHNHHQ